MDYIIGHILIGGGLQWQISGRMAHDPEEDFITINFPLAGAPPITRAARKEVQDALLRPDNNVRWFSLRKNGWFVDLAELRACFQLHEERFAWLDRVVAVEPEYDITTSSHKPHERRGAVSIALDRHALRAAEVAPDRVKQQKFGILDAPNMLHADLEACRQKKGNGTALLFFDIDHFKLLNKELTEEEVDLSILPPIHKRILDIVDHLGFAYAQGGDEFFVLLPNANEEIALAVAETFRRELAALPLLSKGHERRVTISVGVATTASWPIEKLRAEANRAEGIAKERGRNRVEIVRPDTRPCDQPTQREREITI